MVLKTLQFGIRIAVCRFIGGDNKKKPYNFVGMKESECKSPEIIQPPNIEEMVHINSKEQT